MTFPIPLDRRAFLGGGAALAAAASLRPVLEADQLLASDLPDDVGGDGRVRDDGLPHRGLLTVGHEQHPVERDGLPGLGVKQLHLELRAHLDAVLLSAGLDDCVHGRSGLLAAAHDAATHWTGKNASTAIKARTRSV